MKYLISILMILLGMFLVIKSELFLKFFGYSEWGEGKFGMYGGTRTMIKLGGLALIIIGVMWMTGWAQDIIISLFTFGG